MIPDSSDRSWNFLQEVINDLPDDRVSRNDEFIRVIGGSDTPYRIKLNDELPFIVFREAGEDLIQLSIEPRQNESIPLGDLYCALLLTLLDDEHYPGAYWL